ncbi:MFS general substrate transporter [Stipitochalara longipes BDJ]|nr:MFS general substrate transporter [Stipitochalara longipes BDJ]
MASKHTTTQPPTSAEVEKTKVVASDSLSDLEADSASSIAARQPGTLWTIIGCALANFLDGYQQSLASSTNVVFNHILGTKIYTSSIQTRISNALLVGSVIGIVALGYTSDKFSRKGGMLLTSFLVVIGSLLATLAFQVHGAHNMLWFLTIARGIAGVGVGGEYPSSAAAALEGSNEHFDTHRGPIQVLIFTLMATSGGPVCTFVYLASLLGSGNNLKITYHAMYGVSIFLPLFVVFFRVKMQDGELFQKSNFKKRSVPWKLVCRKYWLRLLGTSSAFFLYDFVNFPNSIMSSVIVNSIVPDHNIRTVALWQLILALFPVSGVLLGAWLVNRIGRKWTGVLGFIIGGCYTSLTTKSIPAFVVLYGLLQCLGHMGPGATIGLMSVESYPTAVRGMGYGISAAFTPIQAAAGKAATFFVAGGISVLGIAIYCFLPEGRAVDLKLMDEEFERYMREGGYVDEMDERSS